MKLTLLVAAAAILLPSIASAQSMNAETFYKRSQALKAKGPLAMFSQGEIKVLMTEAQNSGKAARAARLAPAASGQPPRACPPEKSSMGADEFMQRLGSIPLAERKRITMTEAMTRITIARFPCRR